MGFPDKKEINSALKKLKKSEGTLALQGNATPLEKFRWDLCQKFIKYKKVHNITQREMANRLGVDEAKVSKILHHRIDEFSTDRLVGLFSTLDPELILKVS
ncbi:MAG: transcriptional regulator [Bdellovibrionales bacterium RIFOXYB1_FULL_37_110]|nr:MAG: transcriptional regulator [Bdellovibrionales bacterium RIFOXYA1_FULL_38_20]OFZ50516.1 MAG: transcriptional regulator [Bdellovibrionales bacterium RIFOXYC1_FULL_37_79]OFZ60787.1 MAG: transcriptional regulator [Bdellovibrionales bacterium RIFOXYB1_FULL_37_110]OFZ64501.1 MAG: transcriptional regulator [Bdellovibrionales bacterium RIFOXYD1_FULL_36_51]